MAHELPKAKDGYIVPAHYQHGKYEHMQIQESILNDVEFTGFCIGIIIKYCSASRTGDNQLRSFKKAKYYLDELIAYKKDKLQESVDEQHIKPDYYVKQTIQPIDIIEDQLPYEAVIGSHKGQIVRYLTRCFYKGHLLDDLVKAKFYLDRAINFMEQKEKEVKNGN